MENKKSVMLCVNGDILSVGKLRVEQSHDFKKDFNKSFSFSCEIEPSTDLTKLLGMDSEKVDVYYKVRETKERTYPRYPRKMKKAYKKLTMPDQRMTRRMNKLMQTYG